jgi:hypothetical protein
VGVSATIHLSPFGASSHGRPLVPSGSTWVQASGGANSIGEVDGGHTPSNHGRCSYLHLDLYVPACLSLRGGRGCLGARWGGGGVRPTGRAPSSYFTSTSGNPQHTNPYVVRTIELDSEISVN